MIWRRTFGLLSALLLALPTATTGCGESPFAFEGAGDDDFVPGDDDFMPDDDDDDFGDDDDDDNGDDDDDTGTPDHQELCDRWNGDRASLSEGSWSGSVGACNAGDISDEGRENALRIVNLYRWLANLPEVDHDASRNAMTQDCALMMHANGALSHNPPESWTCYTGDGASAAGNSNIATGPGVMAVDMYMADWGNETTMGHRRWILSNGLGPIGLGSTDGYSCMWVLGGSGSGSNQWTAFPPEGPVPWQMMDCSYESTDSTGWTVQSDGISLGGAQVSITTDDDGELPVDVVDLAGGYGSTSAINILPQGWTSQPGVTYHVAVTGISPTIEYDVEMVDCSQY